MYFKIVIKQMMIKIIIGLLILLMTISFGDCTPFPRFMSKKTILEKPVIEKAKKNDDITIEKIEEKDVEIPIKSQIIHTQEGVASFYGYEFHGRRTANGEIFDKDKLTAAHRTLPLGTIAVITNLNNNKKVSVKINDRGPFASGRILDLSYRAAQELDFLKEGVTKVRIEVIKLGDNQYNKQN